MEFKRHRAALVRIDRGCWESIQRVWTLRCKHRSGCRGVRWRWSRPGCSI